MSERLVDVAISAGVTDRAVLAALAEVPRAPFLPPSRRFDAEIDRPVPIGHGQTASQPSLQARMIEALCLVPEHTVLEIGTGSGYQTALLAHIVDRVVSVEIDATLARRAEQALAGLGVTNVTVVVGDAVAGAPDQAPFDGIVVSFAAEGVQDAWREQLVDGGRLVVPLSTQLPDDPRQGRADVTVLRRDGDELVDESVLCAAYFVEQRLP